MAKSLFFLFVVVLVCFLATSMAQAQPPTDDNWNPFTKPTYEIHIQDTSNPEIIEAGQFAISEYDKTTKYHLEFKRVVNATHVYYRQFPFETTWLLYVEARNCSQSGNTDIYVTSVTGMEIRCMWGTAPPDCNYYQLRFDGLWKQLPAV